jgi:hypothetical protein
MVRTVSLAFPLLFLALTAHAADEAKGEKVESTTYPDYFEKNNSGLKGDASYLVFVDKEGFDKVFSLRPPLMGGKKSLPLPNDAFEKKLVIAAIKRGNAITTYNIDKVTVDGETLYIQYKATAGKASTATFASPLIVSADKGKLKKVVFIENEKTVGTVDVK